MTYHDAKGLEFDAVFLPRLVEGELPYRSGRAVAPTDEERRLLYVGITRARKHLFVTREGTASSFWRELLPPRPVARAAHRAAPPSGPHQVTSPLDGIPLSGSLLDVLKRWRDRPYQRREFSTFTDRELAAVAEAAPRDVSALRATLQSEAKADKYASELLDLIGRKLARDMPSGGAVHG